jgi:hypothetical protein
VVARRLAWPSAAPSRAPRSAGTRPLGTHPKGTGRGSRPDLVGTRTPAARHPAVRGAPGRHPGRAASRRSRRPAHRAHAVRRAPQGDPLAPARAELPRLLSPRMGRSLLVEAAPDTGRSPGARGLGRRQSRPSSGTQTQDSPASRPTRAPDRRRAVAVMDHAAPVAARTDGSRSATTPGPVRVNRACSRR